ncbi:MAG: translation initiation factor IF-6 [Promethearchaeota archaeon]
MVGRIQRLDFSGSSNIGAFCKVTEKCLLKPGSTAPTQKALEDLFEMSTIKTTIGHSTLIGILAAGNSNGLLVPHLIFDEELDALREALDLSVTPLESKLTALGNLILANDHAALISPEFSNREIQVIRDTLDVEIEKRTLAESPLVGSYCVVTNSGLLAHTEVTEEELEGLAEFFKVNVDIGTINCGIPYVSIGLLATSQAAAAGFETTGPELMRISETLFG